MKNKIDSKTSDLLSRGEAKEIVKKIIEDQDSLVIGDILALAKWLFETNNCSEDAMVVIETWLQRNDYLVTDEFEYYKQHMETPTFYM